MPAIHKKIKGIAGAPPRTPRCISRAPNYPPRKSMSKKTADDHKTASERLTHAAGATTGAAKRHAAGHNEKAAHHARTAAGHAVHARSHAKRH
jgi:hypothetical protein